MALAGSHPLKSSMARPRHSAGLAFAALAAVCLSTSLTRRGSKAGPGAFVTGAAQMQPMTGAQALPTVAALPAPSASPPSSSSAFCAAAAAAGAVALAMLGAPRRRSSSTGSTQVVPMPRVTMHARSPTPTTPVGTRGKRRIRAGRMRPIFRGRQIAVRVNPKTNKPIRYRMHVMPGDTVQVMKGKDAGKVTTVLRVYTKWNKILCLGVNYCIKHVRPMRDDEVGQRVQVEAPMHSSCVMHYSEAEGVAGLLGIRFETKTLSDGREILKKVRFNKATGEAIPFKTPQKWVPVLDRTEDEDDK